MTDIPRQKLCELTKTYGESLCEEPLRFEGLLRDLCPRGEDRRAVNVLINALKERVARDLISLSSDFPVEATLSRLSKRLEDQQALTREMALWAVESWALALGKISESNLSKPNQKSGWKIFSQPASQPPAKRAPVAPSGYGGALPPSSAPSWPAPRSVPSTVTPPRFSQKYQLAILISVAAVILVGALIFAIIKNEPRPGPEPVTPTPSYAPPTVVPAATPFSSSNLYQTPAPAPTGAPAVVSPTSAPTPAVSDYEARSFVSSFYRTVEGKDLSSLLSLYAESVNYLDYGQRDKSFIREDYVKYYKRWPSLSFTVGDIRVSSSPSDNSATVSFEIQYSVRDPVSNRSKSGRANEEWSLAKSYGELKVRSQRETVYTDKAPAVVAPSAVDIETVRQFIRNYFAALERRDIDAALSSFDNVVSYQGTGNQNKSYIRNDLFKYLSKWTRLNFNLGTIAVSQGPDGRFAVSFIFDYTVFNISNQKRGRSSNNWILSVNQGSLHIVSQQETVQRY